MMLRKSALIETYIMLLVTAIMVVIISFTVILLVPAPVPKLLSLNDIITAIDSCKNQKKVECKIIRRLPTSKRSSVLESVLSSKLNVNDDDVRFYSDQSEAVVHTEVVVSEEGLKPTEVEISDAVSSTLDQFFSGSPLMTLEVANSAAIKQDNNTWLHISPYKPFWSGWRINVSIALLLSLILLAPIGFWAAKRISQPLRSLQRIASNLDLDSSIDQSGFSGSTEIREAAETIANMNRRLKNQVAERTRMVVAIAHDLRTPLTSLKIRIESTPEEQRRKMADDINRMETMITEMLVFARGERAEQAEVVKVNLSLLARTCAGVKGLKHEVSVSTVGADCWVNGVGSRLQRVIGNLIDNAHKYAGAAEIRLKQHAQTVTLEVLDTGPGIEMYDIERMLEPFERGERSRSRDTGGAGLGLAIVQEIMNEHGGSLKLQNRSEGGLCVTLQFPTIY